MSTNIKIPECGICGLPAVYVCKFSSDIYCSTHKKECCSIMKFPQPKPRYSWEGKVN